MPAMPEPMKSPNFFTSGATLRVYLERYEPVGGNLDQETGAMLADIVAAADEIAGIVQHTGRTEPDVIT